MGSQSKESKWKYFLVYTHIIVLKKRFKCGVTEALTNFVCLFVRAMCNYLAMHPAHLRVSHLRLVGDPAVYKHQFWVSVSIVQFTSMVILTRTLTDEHKSSFSCYCWIPCNPLISTGLRSVLSPVCCVCLTLSSSSAPTLPGLTRLSALCSRIVPLVAG